MERREAWVKYERMAIAITLAAVSSGWRRARMFLWSMRLLVDREGLAFSGRGRWKWTAREGEVSNRPIHHDELPRYTLYEGNSSSTLISNTRDAQ